MHRVKYSIALLFAMFLIVGFSLVAFAQSLIVKGAAISPKGALFVSFEEGGLGTNQLITYVASANATATYVCVINAGSHPTAGIKRKVSGQVSDTGTFSSGENGQVTETLVLTAPSSGSFSCPPGQSLKLASVSYTNVVITDTTNNVSDTTTPRGNTYSLCLLSAVRNAC